MSSWSVVDKLENPAIVLGLAVVVIVFLVYVNRGKAILWLIRRGMFTAERVIVQILGIAGVRDPKWVLFVYPGSHHRMMGIMVRQRGSVATVFVPSTPNLLPGQLVFVQGKYIRVLRDISFREGLEVLLTLGSASERSDVMERILSQMEE